LLRGKEKNMKTAITDSNEKAGLAVSSHSTIRNVLLVCGIVSSLFYAGMDVIGGTQWQDYSWISQEFSRLSAIGAPSRPLHLILSPVYTMLVVAFGLGVWWSAGQKRSLRVVGGALVVYALTSIVWPQFFPEDLTAPVSAFTNTMHILLTIVTVLSWMLILGFGATAFGKQFRFYTIGTLLTVLVSGILTAPQGAALATGQPTPWIGLTERINIYSFMVWVIVLAVVLLRTQRDWLQDDPKWSSP
jgi:hypothetical protein